MKAVIVRTRRDIAEYVKTAPDVVSARKSYGAGFGEIEKELVRQILIADGCPEFGEDWSKWLAKHIGECLEEAINIVM